MNLRRALLAVVSLVACAGVGDPVIAETWADFTASVDQEEGLFRQQWQMLEEKKRQIDLMEPGRRRDEMRRRLAEIENRMSAQAHVLYIPPSSNFTAEMDAYYTRMMRRLEDCGTRNFPRQSGASAYGKGAVAISIDSVGRVTKTEILKTSGDDFIDAHMIRIARATSPFGPIPEKPTADTARPYTDIVVYTTFDFEHADDPNELMPESERCTWPVPDDQAPSEPRRSQSFYDTRLPYAKRVADTVKFNIVLPVAVSPESEVEVEVISHADGVVSSFKIVKTNGSPVWEAAVRRAMLKVDRLPLDNSGFIPHVMSLVFRP